MDDESEPFLPLCNLSIDCSGKRRDTIIHTGAAINGTSALVDRGDTSRDRLNGSVHWNAPYGVNIDNAVRTIKEQALKRDDARRVVAGADDSSRDKKKPRLSRPSPTPFNWRTIEPRRDLDFPVFSNRLGRTVSFIVRDRTTLDILVNYRPLETRRGDTKDTRERETRKSKALL